MRFVDRRDAGRLLAARLGPLPPGAVVLGLPRGGVIVAAEVAAANGVALGVLVVRKLGAPRQPEYALGAIGEGGVRLIDERAVASTRTTREQLAAVEDAERAELERRLQRYRAGAPRPELAGRTVVLVDDGLATGATATVACAAVRRLGAAHVVVAVPVAPPELPAALLRQADEVVVLAAPSGFRAVGQWYERFPEVSDAEVRDALGTGEEPGPSGP